MTFQDDMHHKCEDQAAQSARWLQLWLATIAPIPGPQSIELLTQIEQLAVDMGWPMEHDVILDRLIIK